MKREQIGTISSSIGRQKNEDDDQNDEKCLCR